MYASLILHDDSVDITVRALISIGGLQLYLTAFRPHCLNGPGYFMANPQAPTSEDSAEITSMLAQSTH